MVIIVNAMCVWVIIHHCHSVSWIWAKLHFRTNLMRFLRPETWSSTSPPPASAPSRAWRNIALPKTDENTRPRSYSIWTNPRSNYISNDVKVNIVSISIESFESFHYGYVMLCYGMHYIVLVLILILTRIVFVVWEHVRKLSTFNFKSIVVVKAKHGP